MPTKRIFGSFIVSIGFVSCAFAQSLDSNPAMNSPDKVSWELFALVNSPVPGLDKAVLFETLGVE